MLFGTFLKQSSQKEPVQLLSLVITKSSSLMSRKNRRATIIVPANLHLAAFSFSIARLEISQLEYGRSGTITCEQQTNAIPDVQRHERIFLLVLFEE